jgi:quercetin dioxygenase-like cupin family protein
VVSFDTGEIMVEKTIPFDTFIQVIDGEAEIIIKGKSHILKTGEAIIIPDHAANSTKGQHQIQVDFNRIQSGYEDLV